MITLLEDQYYKWQLSEAPFPAFRAIFYGKRHFLGVSKDFNINMPSKLIQSETGLPIIVNCPEYEDENIILMTLINRCLNNSKIELYGGEIIYKSKFYPGFEERSTQFIGIRFSKENGYLLLQSRFFQSDVYMYKASGEVSIMSKKELRFLKDQYSN